jgi:hypothetical protein
MNFAKAECCLPLETSTQMQASTHVARGFFAGKIVSLSHGWCSLSKAECQFCVRKDASRSEPGNALSLILGGGRGEEIWELTLKWWRNSYRVSHG